MIWLMVDLLLRRLVDCHRHPPYDQDSFLQRGLDVDNCSRRCLQQLATSLAHRGHENTVDHGDESTESRELGKSDFVVPAAVLQTDNDCK